jgi:hypothetical protein
VKHFYIKIDLFVCLIFTSFFVLLFFVYLFKTESHYVAQAGLELFVLLPQPPDCWDYRSVLTGFLLLDVKGY